MKMQYSTSQLLELRHALKVSIECPEIKEIEKDAGREKALVFEYLRGVPIGTSSEITGIGAPEVAYPKIPMGSLMLRFDPGVKIPHGAFFIPYIPVGNYAPADEPNPESIHETTHYDRDGNKLSTGEENASVTQETFAKPTKFKYMPGVASKDNPYAVTGFFPSESGSTSDADTNSYSHSTYASSDIQIQLPPV